MKRCPVCKAKINAKTAPKVHKNGKEYGIVCNLCKSIIACILHKKEEET